jgi:hypothetical protein
MRKQATYAAVAAMALGTVAFVGCKKEDTTTASRTTTTTTNPPTTSPGVSVDVNTDQARSAADRTGDAINRGLDKTGDALANAADKTKEVARDVGGKINDAAHRTGDAANRAVDRAANRTENATDDAQQAASRGTPGAPDAEGIRDVVAQVTEAALTKGGLDDMVERFVDADRNRLGQNNALDTAKDDPTLTGRIDQFRKDWKAKYGKDFNIKDEEAALPASTFMIAQGEIPRGAAGASVDVNRQSDGSVKVDVDNRSGVDQPGSNAADTNRNDPGRNIAMVRVASSHGLPDLQVPMIHEAPDRWKIDVPESLTADKLRQNVLDHLTMADNPAQWPDDVNQAYAQVAHHVLMAVLDKPAR